jgi:CRP/FNR family transcriptional regulator, cyclic AMP receptor protein
VSGSDFFDYGSEQGASAPKVTFLADATVDDWAMVVEHCERRRFHRGDVVVRVGDVDRSLLIVVDGDLETVAERRGKQRRLSPAPAGSVVGELGFLDGQPRSATVIAVTDGELLRMSAASFESLAAANPRLGRMILADLGRILASRLRALTVMVMTR